MTRTDREPFVLGQHPALDDVAAVLVRERPRAMPFAEIAAHCVTGDHDEVERCLRFLVRGGFVEQRELTWRWLP